MSVVELAPARASESAVRGEFDRRLEALRARCPFKYFKLGTEVEALSFEEIAYTRDTLPADVGVYVKIGGPGAVNDIRAMGRIGVQGLIAPMVESVYGLHNFLESIAGTLPSSTALGIAKGINLETVTCYRAFDEISSEPAFARLSLCNIGRSDLATSMQRKVTDPEVTTVVSALIRACRARNMSIHVGGQVTGPTLASTLATDPPDGFHTRFLAFAVDQDLPRVAATVDAALELELAYLALLARRFPDSAPLHETRMRVTAERLDEHRRWAQALPPPK